MTAAMCPHCDLLMKKQVAAKTMRAIEYHCRNCGQHYTKVAGEKGYHKGQIINLPQVYWHRGPVIK